MAFRSNDQDFRWRGRSRPPHGREHHEAARSDAGEALSLSATLRELAATIVGFLGLILLITAALSALHA